MKNPVNLSSGRIQGTGIADDPAGHTPLRFQGRLMALSPIQLLVGPAPLPAASQLSLSIRVDER